MGVTRSATKAHIRFSTQIIKRLGEELNPSVDQSILELVKNSYDADARKCTVELENITDTGGAIKIEDDGNGMNEKEIINGWLVLGESSKSIHKRTGLGRIPAGSKGLGRLAALRMGHLAELQSVSKKNKAFKYELEIDWDEFDKAKLVDDIFLSVNKVNAPTNAVGHNTNSTCSTMDEHRHPFLQVTQCSEGIIRGKSLNQESGSFLEAPIQRKGKHITMMNIDV